jgi:hypothetical protein
MFDVSKLVGMEETEAETTIKDAKLSVRIKEQDGEAMMGTMDVRDDRVNLKIENGKVVSADIG